MNYRGFNRIDTFELISVILLSIDGTFEQYLKNVIFIFGFTDNAYKETITLNELHFYLDCTFRGVMTFVVPPKQIQTAKQRKVFRDGIN